MSSRTVGAAGPPRPPGWQYRESERAPWVRPWAERAMLRSMLAKTNAARALDALGVAYELRSYRSDPEDLSPGRLEREIGLPRAAIYKTLVLCGERGGALFAVLPVAEELDLKALARAASDKRVELLPRSRLQSVTGYVRGGVTALASKKALPVFLETSALSLEQFGVSAGTPGLELVLRPEEYVRATGARVQPLVLPQ